MYSEKSVPISCVIANTFGASGFSLVALACLGLIEPVWCGLGVSLLVTTLALLGRRWARWVVQEMTKNQLNAFQLGQESMRAPVRPMR